MPKRYNGLARAISEVGAVASRLIHGRCHRRAKSASHTRQPATRPRTASTET